MERARLQAVLCGDTTIAASLAADLASLRRPGLRFSASAVYERVHDMLLDVPTATLEQVVDVFAYEYGLTPDEVRHRYRRLPYWYTRYRREDAEEARLHLQFIASTGMDGARRADWQQRLDALTH